MLIVGHLGPPNSSFRWLQFDSLYVRSTFIHICGPNKFVDKLEVTIARKVLPYDLRLDYTNFLNTILHTL